MTKFILTLTIFFAALSFTIVKAESFEANDLAIEQTFQNSTEMTSNAAMMENMMTTTSNATQFKGGEKSALVAFLLATFLGELGVHRFYMGTAVLTGVGYILTAGGCGIVATIDWVFLLIGLVNDDISKYVDNTKFFMW
jgi:TM2 domain-containing membrane protein YozV